MDLKAIIESLIISARNPLSMEQLALLTGCAERMVARAIAELEIRYKNFGIQLVKVGDGYKYGPHPESAQWLAEILDESVPLRALDSAHSDGVRMRGVDPDYIEEKATSNFKSREALRPTFTGPVGRTLTPSTVVHSASGEAARSAGLQPRFTGPMQRASATPGEVEIEPLREAPTVEVRSGEHAVPDEALVEPLDDLRTEETLSAEVVLPETAYVDETREVPIRDLETLVAQGEDDGDGDRDADLRSAVDQAIGRAEELLRKGGGGHRGGSSTP